MGPWDNSEQHDLVKHSKANTSKNSLQLSGGYFPARFRQTEAAQQLNSDKQKNNPSQTRCQAKQDGTSVDSDFKMQNAVDNQVTRNPT